MEHQPVMVYQGKQRSFLGQVAVNVCTALMVMGIIAIVSWIWEELL